MTRRAAALLLAAAFCLLAGCASLHPLPPGDRPVSQAIPLSPATELGRVAAASLSPGQSSAFRPLAMSNFSFDARLVLARRAQASLDLQYYLIQNDTTGRTLLREVRDAALRGVRVRVLVDDLYTASTDQLLLGLAAYPNVEVRLFNPFPAGRAFMATRFAFSLLDFARVNHRMHNKMFIADGAFAVAGGRNMADEYFFKNKVGNFLDFDLLVCGEAVPTLAGIFDEYWRSIRVYPLEAIASNRLTPEERRDAFERATAGEANPRLLGAADRDLYGFGGLSDELSQPPLRMLYGRVTAFADDPEKVVRHDTDSLDDTVTGRVMRAFTRSRSQLLLISPYFVPSTVGLAGLKEAREAGLKVRVVTNSMGSNDEPLASAAYARRRVAMLKMGVELYEISSRELKLDKRFSGLLGASIGRSHTKLAVMDRKTVFVGSMNMDFRSARENTELGLLVDSEELAEGAVEAVNLIIASGTYKLRLRQPGDHIEWLADEDGVDKVYTSEPEVDLATRLQILLLAPFVPDSML